MATDSGSTSNNWRIAGEHGLEDPRRMAILSQMFAATRPNTPLETLPCAPFPMAAVGAEPVPTVTRLGQYVLEEALGMGGFGAVYAARCGKTGRRVAIKFLHHRWAKAHEVVLRLFREAEAISKIAHPNIVEIYHWGWITEHVPAIVMELFEGKSLGRIVEVRGRLSFDEALEYFEPVCEALSAAHRAGIIHRDIKASNVLVRREEGRTEVKLIDFGIAKLLAPDVPDLTRTGFVVGSPAAASPEQIMAKPVDERTDVYGLGVMLYHLLTGSLPFRDTSAEGFLAKHLGARPPNASHSAPVGLAVDQVILKAMAKDPSDRFQSVDEFLSSLRCAAAEGRETRTVRTKRITKSAPRVELVPQSPKEEARQAPAIAFFVELLQDGNRIDVDALDDDALDELQNEMDQIHEDLTQVKFSIPIQTSTELMGCLLLDAADMNQIAHTWQPMFEICRGIVRRVQTVSRFQVAARIDIGMLRLRNTQGTAPQISSPESLNLYGGSLERSVGFWSSCRGFWGQLESLESKTDWAPVEVPNHPNVALS